MGHKQRFSPIGVSGKLRSEITIACRVLKVRHGSRPASHNAPTPNRSASGQFPAAGSPLVGGVPVGGGAGVDDQGDGQGDGGV